MYYILVRLPALERMLYIILPTCSELQIVWVLQPQGSPFFCGYSTSEISSWPLSTPTLDCSRPCSVQGSSIYTSRMQPQVVVTTLVAVALVGRLVNDHKHNKKLGTVLYCLLHRSPEL